MIGAELGWRKSALVLNIYSSPQGGGGIFRSLPHGGDLLVEGGLVEAPGLAYELGFRGNDICGLSA